MQRQGRQGRQGVMTVMTVEFWKTCWHHLFYRSVSVGDLKVSPSSGLLTGTVKAKEMGTVHVENALSTCVSAFLIQAMRDAIPWPLALCVKQGLWTETTQRIKACHGHFSSCQKFICSHAWRSTLPVTMHFHKMNKAQLPLCPDLKHVAVDIKDIKLLRNLVPSRFRVKLRKSSAWYISQLAPRPDTSSQVCAKLGEKVFFHRVSHVLYQ